MNSIRILFSNFQGVTRECLELLNFAQENNNDSLLFNKTHLRTINALICPTIFPTTPIDHWPLATQPLVERLYLQKEDFHLPFHIQTQNIEIKIDNTILRIVAVYKRSSFPILTTDLLTRRPCCCNNENRQYKAQHGKLPTILSSDHTPVILEIYSKATQLAPPTASHIVHWPSFQTNMETSIFYNHLDNSTLTIDQATDELTSTIFTNIAKNTSFSTNTANKCLSSEIQQQIRHLQNCTSVAYSKGIEIPSWRSPLTTKPH